MIHQYLNKNDGRFFLQSLSKGCFADYIFPFERLFYLELTFFSDDFLNDYGSIT